MDECGELVTSRVLQYTQYLEKLPHITTKLSKSDLKEHVLKTTHFVNSHFADTVDQSKQSIVTVDQSELSIENILALRTDYIKDLKRNPESTPFKGSGSGRKVQIDGQKCLVWWSVVD